ncbi:restriction endonuclease subunit S [Mycoplasmopsis gallinarum]
MPEFSKFLFRTELVRKQIINNSFGVTRFNASIKTFENIKIPIPSLQLQNKIVNILDTFSIFSAELKAELKARNDQYDYYLNSIFESIKNNKVNNILREREWVSLSEISTIKIGKQIDTKELNDNSPFPYMNGGINKSGNYYQFNQKANTIIISQGGASAGYVQWMKDPFWQGSHCFALENIHSKVNNRYLYFYLKSKQDLIYDLVNGTAIPGLKKSSLENLKIILPSIQIQRKLVNVLDNFESICKDLNIGLPVEIEKRQQQYEFYRDQIFYYLENNALDNRLRERERRTS